MFSLFQNCLQGSAKLTVYVYLFTEAIDGFMPSSHYLYMIESQ